MSAPANLYPGLNDISDALEELPIEAARYLTLLREIDAKCVHTVPELNGNIDAFLKRSGSESVLTDMNALFQDLMPSLEEKMHVSALAFEALERLTARLELAYEVAIKNEEIPPKLRLGNDNHPAMHIHHELMAKIETKNGIKSSQALKSESRREAMAARRTTTPHVGGNHAKGAAGGAGQVNSGTISGVAPPMDSRKRRGHGHAEGALHNEAATDVAASLASAAVLDTKKKKRKSLPKENFSQRPKTNEYGEALYCYCNQVAYGEMVGCDGENCVLEWFHLPCIGLETLPKGKWYCDNCRKMP
ncbi:LAMI_0D00870g1_1 [Lachancea mirantina]|uniref:Chromatin modification-related protein n=1 Tax=Lachancea mirantina TaxID=1230905 RepID=A0A1G4J929_9SACH|nr:LAMI_0D00870g1_1 [Lachancea mirantina]